MQREKHSTCDKTKLIYTETNFNINIENNINNIFSLVTRFLKFIKINLSTNYTIFNFYFEICFDVEQCSTINLNLSS